MKKKIIELFTHDPYGAVVLVIRVGGLEVEPCIPFIQAEIQGV